MIEIKKTRMLNCSAEFIMFREEKNEKIIWMMEE